MATKRQRYGRGSCFLVPLRHGGYLRGVILWMNMKGVAFGYFFGPTLESAAEASLLESVEPQDSLLAAQFGDLGLRNGEWPVLGELPPSLYESLILPEFVRATSDGDVLISRYDEKMELLSERRGTAEDLRKLPRETLMGYGSVEIALTKLVGNAQ